VSLPVFCIPISGHEPSTMQVRTVFTAHDVYAVRHMNPVPQFISD